MKLIRDLINVYKELLRLGERTRSVDEKVYLRIEEAAERVGDALTMLRMRGKLDPKEKEEIEKVMVSL